MAYGCLIIVALGMIGLPPTGGFFGKWNIILGAIEAGNYFSVAAVVFSTLLTLAYFVKLFEGIFRQTSTRLDTQFSEIPLSFKLTLGITSAAILLLGLFSSPIVELLLNHAMPPRLLRELMTHFILIPLLPLLASLILLIGGRRWGENSHLIGIPAIGFSFVLSVAAFIEVLKNGPFTVSLYRLFQSGSLTIDLTLYVDQLTVLLLLLVTGVSGVVHVYSSRYMIGESRYNRFFAVIALFTFSMILLVMSGNLLMLLISWEVMGLCSYLLISHAAERPSACRAATKAFLINAAADIGFSFGIILAFFTFGTLDIPTILAQAEGMQDFTINILGWMGLELNIHPVTVIPFLLFMGAMGKSAQMPFHVWLPLAMEAPTPVSALIHAATMVNAGPFLLVRLSPLIILSPYAMGFIAIIGISTAVFAGIVSLTQSDIKKILAYSTISQIGFMVMACGLGAFSVAIFHLLAHGCYKAFFFLSTGNALRSVEPGHRHSDHEHHASEGMGIL